MHKTIKRAGITYKKTSLQKSTKFDIPLKKSPTRYKHKTKMFLVIKALTCWICKDKKRIEVDL